MKTALVALSLAVAFTVPLARGQEDPPAEPSKPAEATGQDRPAESEPTKSVFPTPIASSPRQLPAITTAITDIDADRVTPLPYVRRMADVVRTDFGKLNIEADPVLFVGDRPISRNEFRKRALMYMSGAEIDMEVTHALTEQEVRRQTEAGVDPATLAADDAAIDKKFAEQKDMVSMQARQQAQVSTEADAAAEKAISEFVQSIENSPGGMAEYRQLLSADVQFEKVFLPFPKGKVEGTAHDPTMGPPPVDEPRPDWFPQQSWDALGTDDQGRTLRSWVKKAAIDGEELPSIFKPNIVSKLREGLIKAVGVDFFFDADLPDDVFMRVGSTVVKVDDMWARSGIQLADADIDLIVRELLSLEGMKKELQANNQWPDHDAAAEAWKKHDAVYAASIFPTRIIAMFKGYASIDRYREHYRYRSAFNEWKKASVPEEEVKRHYEQGGRLFFMRGDAVVDIGFAPLGDKPFTDANLEATRQALIGAMDQARTAAASAPADSATPYAWFSQIKTAFPAPPTGQSPDNAGFQRSQLRMQLAEDELSIFLTGYSLADDIIYHGHPGDLYGPLAQRARRHAWGAEPNAGSWLVLVNGFRTRSPLGPFEGPQKDLAWEDYLDLNFFNWSEECLKSEVLQVKTPPVAGG